MRQLHRLLREVHQRSLWQVLGVYLAGSWIALQVVEQLAEAAALPEWVRPFALVLLVLGLPVVLATAFIQQGVGSGARAEPEPTSAPSASAHRLFTWRNAVVGGVIATVGWAVVATGMLLTGRGSQSHAAAARGDGAENQNIVAVLPFVNMSAEESNAFFAEGVHEEILNSLSQIDALRVISRTSVLRYAESDKTLPEIGRELGAGAVLEGSVRRAGERVRVTAQLIDVASDQHLWSRTFDGDVSDIFSIQTEVAQQVSLALAAELTDDEQTDLDTRPTEDVAAYDAYLEGLSHRRRRLVRADATAAAESFRRERLRRARARPNPGPGHVRDAHGGGAGPLLRRARLQRGARRVLRRRASGPKPDGGRRVHRPYPAAAGTLR